MECCYHLTLFINLNHSNSNRFCLFNYAEALFAPFSGIWLICVHSDAIFAPVHFQTLFTVHMAPVRKCYIVFCFLLFPGIRVIIPCDITFWNLPSGPSCTLCDINTHSHHSYYVWIHTDFIGILCFHILPIYSVTHQDLAALLQRPH